jgi:hypothetical protein
MLTEAGLVKLLDFGLAKLTDLVRPLDAPATWNPASMQGCR